MTLPRVLFVVRHGRPAVVRDRTFVLGEGLRALGHEVVVVVDGFAEAAPGDVLFLQGSANYFPATWKRLRALTPEERPASLLWQIEPLPPPADSGLRPARRHLREWAKIALRDARTTDPKSNWARLRRLRGQDLPSHIAVSTGARQTFLAEQGVESTWAPFGHYDLMGDDLGLERDIDVMFLGAPDVPRRRRIIRRMRRAGIDVRSEGAWGRRGLWGDERTQVLSRTKILLNLGRHPGELSGLRLLKGMGTRCCVLSEPIYDPRPYVPGLHYAEAPIDSLADEAAALLADDARRTTIADAGHAFAMREQTIDRTLAILSEALARAAATPRPARPPG